MFFSFKQQSTCYKGLLFFVLLSSAWAKKRYGLEFETGQKRANDYLQGQILDAKTGEVENINTLIYQLQSMGDRAEKDITVVIDGVARRDFNVLWDGDVLEIKYKDSVPMHDKEQFEKDLTALSKMTGTEDLLAHGSYGDSTPKFKEHNYASIHADVSDDGEHVDFTAVNERVNILHTLELMDKGLGDSYLSHSNSIDFNPEFTRKGILRQRDPKRTELRVFPKGYLATLDRYDRWTDMDPAVSLPEIESLIREKLHTLQTKYSVDAEGNLPLLTQAIGNLFSNDKTTTKLDPAEWEKLFTRLGEGKFGESRRLELYKKFLLRTAQLPTSERERYQSVIDTLGQGYPELRAYTAAYNKASQTTVTTKEKCVTGLRKKK